ncbi:MBOAT family O-acyltransferase [Aliarcobacter butzleri]|uniref:MBOAT family O-acyltransferase n=1 Tax=Aliarcobacter butzleri TaxID=28197 RepID=UPI00126076D3|nr:MBOAT family protein [Aliarcobacter butzleri]MCT7626486.1 MBOAT family protein [Aliarcobacter butzleri]MCT7637783.1 MBOAT family protein [Aliarcobacter butzleri]MCT7643764.1 MBOAT family protein [Aliarcobacter butzleri]MDN5045278.1 MBOAT family protein [Aliarcobacter butzleri]UXC28836.1 MBOAT family protein [Aliarcobacter butzleri]
MLFNSYEFIFIFLPVMFVVYFYLNGKRLILGAKIWLVVGSLFFYSYWNVIYLPLILLSIFVNYGVGLSLVNHEKIRISSKTILSFGIVFNLGLLGYFKYTDFFLDNFNGIFGTNIPLPHIILPLGISFFTFTQIAFLVDAYKQEAKEYSLINYMLFVTYFPHLLAGPILHHKEMMPQFASKYNWVKNYRNIALGLFIFSIGLFKKVVIADTFAVWANAGFDTATTLNLIEAWATSLSYTFQLYFDFSGYTDMAIGISLMFNIKLPINFNSPYKALSIQDFWRRWHMTLSRFLRDYLYIPLGGNRKGNIKTYVNLITTFLLGGLWHGAGWTFIIWGLLHGIALAIHRLWQSLGFRMNKILAWFITFNFINITWIFFRAKDFESAMKVLSSMFSFDNVVFEIKKIFVNIGSNDSKEIIIWIIISFILVLFFSNSMEKMRNFKTNKKIVFLTVFCFIIGVLSLHKVSEFLYFNF